jgi:hypothetical protein
MGGGASAPRQPLQSLSAESVRELVEGLGPKFADIAQQLEENGYDGEILVEASGADLAELFEELEVPKLKQKVLRKKLEGLKERSGSLDEGPAEGGGVADERPAERAAARRIARRSLSTHTTASCRIIAPTARTSSRACTIA